MILVKSLKLSILSLCALLFVGCEMMDTTPVGEPVLLLDTDELHLNGGGGEVPIFYVVQNGVSKRRPTAKSSDSWISIKEITSDTIMLLVEESNINEQRMGFVTISYEGIEKSSKVVVLQDKQLLNKFSFEVSDLTTTSCSIKYTPKEQGVQFMANVIDYEYFKQSGVNDMNIFIDNEMQSYRALAEQNKLTLESLLLEYISPQLIFDDVAVRSFNNMQPGGTYVAYAYGVEFQDNDYTVTIPFHQITIQLPMSQFYDIKFRVSAQLGSDDVAKISVTPLNWSKYYVVSVIPDSSLYYVNEGDDLSEYTLRALSNEFYQRARKAMQSGITADAFLRSNCYAGDQLFNISVSGGLKYMVVVYAVESENGAIPVMCSMPTLSYL